MSPSFHASTADWPQISAADLAQRIVALAQGERLVVLGIDHASVGNLVSGPSGNSRGVLLVACTGLLTAAAIIDRLLDDLAELALDCWPHWQGRDVSVEPVAGDPWLTVASKRARLGSKPRFRRAGRELELVRLLGAIDPAGLILVWEVDPASAVRAGPVIEALDWCRRQGAVVVATLTVAPPVSGPYDRILYGACALALRQSAARERFIAPAGTHHASAIEQRVAAALEQDADLTGLFACNAPVSVGAWGAKPRVDLLCDTHRVVVELDGPEHRAEPKFSADRHRDYELLTAGYLVLRLTNAQVAADLPLAIEKIRSVVRLRSVAEKDWSR